MEKTKRFSILILMLVLLFACRKKDNPVALTYTLYITAFNGTVVKNPDMPAYNSGAKVDLTATPNSNYKFSSWSGDAEGSANTLTVTMNSNKNITANMSLNIAQHAPPPTNPLVVNVFDTGATPDDGTDDTQTIQAAVDQVAGTGGTVLVPAGTYMIDALASVNLKSNMTFRMENRSVLKAITNSATNYSIIKIFGVSDVNVIGGTTQGERTTHTGTGGEWGMGVDIRNSSNIFVEGVTARDCWGDGFYVAGENAGGSNIYLSGVVADYNRRQGFSLISGRNIVVQNSIFKNTVGTNPQAGIDIEPDRGMSVDGVWILNSQFINNHFGGIFTWADAGPISNVTIDGNTFSGNDGAVGLVKSTGDRVTNNRISDKTVGISMDSYGGVQGATVMGNTICAPNPITGAAGNSVTYNTTTTTNCPSYPEIPIASRATQKK